MSNNTVANELVVKRTSQPLTGLVPLIEHTVFGSDGLRYKRLNVDAQLQRFNDPTYFQALLYGELVGSYVLDRRSLLIRNEAVTGYYRGVLAVATQMQGRGIGKRLTETAGRWLQETAGDTPLLSYGCIDQSNKRSLHVLKSTGALPGPSLSMYMMYRQWPRARCELVTEDVVSVQACTALADEVYADCQIRDISDSNLPLLVLEDANGVAIAARIADNAFQITAMGTMARWGTRFLVSPFAPARKRFDPDQFRYLSLSNVLIRPGCESLLSDFVSTILARYHCHFAAVFVDPNSRLFQQIQKANRITSFMHSKKGSIQVVTRLLNKNEDLQEPLKEVFSDSTQANHPIHLWPIDA